jgi:hypothetical protein
MVDAERLKQAPGEARVESNVGACIDSFLERRSCLLAEWQLVGARRLRDFIGSALINQFDGI